jgi:hypothetical protein
MTHCLVNHHLTDHIVFVLVSTEDVMMCPVTDNPTSCEILAFIRFLRAKNTCAAEIHRELCAVYGQNIINEGTVRQCYIMFKDGRTYAHDEECSGRPASCSE